MACLTPLFKEGAKDDPSNYRSIAILPACSIILERVIHTQIHDYLTYLIGGPIQVQERPLHSHLHAEID